ncbi:MAG: Crp/Fnr family transcriptional regulator [Flavobacteriales bacterium]|nr:Crp/Fnr family transcriptional regulator [Flavobacteriales bacterium]
MDDLLLARKALPLLEGEVVEKMLAAGKVVDAPEGTMILHEGGYVRELPILLEGLVRVYTGNDEKELLLYYIEPAQSCVMSFAAMMDHTSSRINAVTEVPSKLLMLPEPKMRALVTENPSLMHLLLQQYQQRYNDMLTTVQQVAFGDLPTRLMLHLERLAEVTGSRTLDVRHVKLAQELGTAREVVTRTLKKLEREGRLRQKGRTIELLK